MAVELSNVGQMSFSNLMAKVNRQESFTEKDTDEKREPILMSIRDTNDTLRLRPINHWERFQQRRDVPIFNPFSSACFCWTFFVFLCIIISGMYIPYEVGFKDPKIGGKFFWINRCMDLIFLMDLIVTFNTPYLDPSTGRLVTSRRRIAWNYLNSWLFSDLLCLIPFDVISAVAENGNSDVGLIRLIRILRMIKVVRVNKILKTTNMIQKLELYTGLDFYTMSILKFAFTIIFAVHIMACGLHVIVLLEDADQNWVYNYFGIYSQKIDSITLYITCLYWSAMTTSTIGYGDVGMITNAEKLYSIICMVIGATLYAFMTGNICGTVLRMNEFETNFGELTYEVDTFLKDNSISSSLSNATRTFLLQKHKSDQPYDEKEILKLLSPVLRGKLVETIHKPWMRRTMSLRYVENKLFISQLALLVETKLFAPKERIIRVGANASSMYIVKKGILIVGALDYRGKDDVIGEEMIRTPMVTRTYEVNAGMRHVALMEIERDAFMDLVEKFGTVKKAVKKAALKLAFRERARDIVRYLRSEIDELDADKLEMDRRRSLAEWEEGDGLLTGLSDSKVMDFLSSSTRLPYLEEVKQARRKKRRQQEEEKEEKKEDMLSWFENKLNFEFL